MYRSVWVLWLMIISVSAGPAMAGITVAPYASIKSTKSIKPDAKDKSKENEKIRQRKEAGLRASVTFYSLFGLQLSVGQNQLTTTDKLKDAKDEYGEIDYQKDLNMSTTDPDNDIKVTETQRNAKLGIVFDPSFAIFILRAKGGVQATQRIIQSQVTGKPAVNKTFGPTYKPYSGFGVGVRFSPKMYAMAEYNFYHYAFPNSEPFEREAAITYGLEL